MRDRLPADSSRFDEYSSAGTRRCAGAGGAPHARLQAGDEVGSAYSDERATRSAPWPPPDDALVQSEIADPACAPDDRAFARGGHQRSGRCRRRNRACRLAGGRRSTRRSNGAPADAPAERSRGRTPPRSAARRLRLRAKPARVGGHAGELVGPCPMAGRPGMLVARRTSALICIAERARRSSGGAARAALPAADPRAGEGAVDEGARRRRPRRREPTAARSPRRWGPRSGAPPPCESTVSKRVGLVPRILRAERRAHPDAAAAGDHRLAVVERDPGEDLPAAQRARQHAVGPLLQRDLEACRTTQLDDALRARRTRRRSCPPARRRGHQPVHAHRRRVAAGAKRRADDLSVSERSPRPIWAQSGIG